MKTIFFSKKSLSVIIFFFIFMTSTVALGNDSFKLKISYATYTDLDGDNYKDDVLIHFKILNKEMDADKDDDNDKNEFRIYYKLELPSGQLLDDTFYVKLSQNVLYHEFQIYHFNAAMESGWYKAYIYLFEDNYYKPIDKDIIVFDPPGAGTGDPDILLI